MSSFIVSQECMNRIINGIYFNRKMREYYPSFFRENKLIDERDFQNLGDALFVLNTSAVNYRYEENEQPGLFKWELEPNYNKFQVLKSMKCLRYQCSEGDFDQSKLYKLLDEIIQIWQELIVDSLPEYEKAQWG